ncbi:unnamed protein product [Lepeophtheirus salmonis]|uniref:(salmon louse) hypothetical protein n=1 Tax=Lepeophtheirus salmonis TaxID=72036 RepID=A0A7R8CX06_LEPSM|nr:unnamed protein product [Lepeophtheirus salmonis]CAF2927075.1 unnamed protein product [Lepeophtheirus salmonis]
MDWLNFGEVDLIASPLPPPPNHDDPEVINSRLKSKAIEEDITEINHNDIVEPQVDTSFGDPEFQDNDVDDMYNSLLSDECQTNPSEGPFYELEKVAEVDNATKSLPLIDDSTRNFLEAIENFLSNNSNKNRLCRDSDIISSPKRIVSSERNANLSFFNDDEEVNRRFNFHLDDKKRMSVERCNKPIESIIPKEEITNDSIHFDKSSKESFRITNISEFVDRANGRNIIILVADNRSQPHDPGKLRSFSGIPESFQISSSSNDLLKGNDSSSSSSATTTTTTTSTNINDHNDNSSSTADANNCTSHNNNSNAVDESIIANLTTGTNVQISNQVEEPSLSLSQCPDETAQENFNELITFPRMGTSMALTSSSSSSSSCSSSPKSFHFNKSPQIMLGPGGPNLDSHRHHHLILSPSQLKSPPSPPLPLLLPKRGKRTLQERRKIKKWQNIEAARRYRDRKKLEMETSVTQVKILEAANKQLYDKMDLLQNKVSNLKKILSRLGLLT